ncbi:MAG: amine dehydrogenase [Azonexus sp.]|jgi:methylamine dehydrogenase heavy chain|nr:amine dehydrogenase [Azonexus sp.]
MNRLLFSPYLLGVAGVLLTLAVHAALPEENISIEPLAAPNPQRLYLNDPAMGHIVDGRIHVIDTGRMRYLGLIGAGYAASTTLSRDGKLFFVATTYNSRLQRGERTDVIEAWRTSDLKLDYEIVIPPKRAQALHIKALVRTTADDRFLLVQNATPATSVTVVDLQARKAVSEIALPGCWGVIPWPQSPRRFSTVCGDGSLTTIELDADGKETRRSAGLRFFDPDSDPVFMHYELSGNRLLFVSFYGNVYSLKLESNQPQAEAPWSFVDEKAKKQGWRPGGFALFALEPKRNRLIIGMHPKGSEGSHKNPASELWVIDLAQRRVVTRVPGHMALSITVIRDERPELIVLNAVDNTLLAFDLNTPRGLSKPARRSGPIGETPVFMETH